MGCFDGFGGTTMYGVIVAEHCGRAKDLRKINADGHFESHKCNPLLLLVVVNMFLI